MNLSNLSQLVANGNYSIAPNPIPVGYWILDPRGAWHTKMAIYSRPTDAQIKYTEEMLGWKWCDYA